jgi:hypothetical protein
MGMTDDVTGTKAKVVKSRVVLVLTIFFCSLFTMGKTKMEKNVKLMKKRERLNQNGNKLIFVQNKIVELSA